MAKNAAVTDVVHLDSDSDSDNGVVGGRESASTIAGAATMAPRETLECRSFWKAGDYFVIPNVVTPTAPGHLSLPHTHACITIMVSNEMEFDRYA
jgi:uncharacterized RmlC-like cupin family protein